MYDSLLQDLTNSLVGILVSVQQNPVASMANVETTYIPICWTKRLRYTEVLTVA